MSKINSFLSMFQFFRKFEKINHSCSQKYPKINLNNILNFRCILFKHFGFKSKIMPNVLLPLDLGPLELQYIFLAIVKRIQSFPAFVNVVYCPCSKENSTYLFGLLTFDSLLSCMYCLSTKKSRCCICTTTWILCKDLPEIFS